MISFFFPLNHFISSQVFDQTPWKWKNIYILWSPKTSKEEVQRSCKESTLLILLPPPKSVKPGLKSHEMNKSNFQPRSQIDSSHPPLAQDHVGKQKLDIRSSDTETNTPRANKDTNVSCSGPADPCLSSAHTPSVVFVVPFTFRTSDKLIVTHFQLWLWDCVHMLNRHVCERLITA